MYKRFVKILILSFVFFFVSQSGVSQSQTALSLDTCFALLEKNYPLMGKLEIIDKEKEYSISNIKKDNFPTFSISADVSYQSEVPTIAFNSDAGKIFYSPENKLRYGVNLDVDQTVFDAGITKKKRELTSSEYDAEIQNINIELENVKSTVCDLFYNAVLVDTYIEQLQLAMDRIVSRKDVVNAAVKNGLALASDLDLIKVEIIKLEGHIYERTIQKKMIAQNLSILLGTNINENTRFAVPEMVINKQFVNRRPELQLFEVHKNRITAAENLYKTYWPQVDGFARIGYGNPGYYDFFYEKAHPYLFIGLKMNWTFWDWDKARTERKKLNIGKDKLNVDRALFDMNVKLNSNSYLDEIERYEMLIKKDRQIINLMESISSSAESQYNNGEITFSEYYEKLNSELNAKLELNTHEIMLQRAKTKYLLNLGLY
ncbi:TolC family protein [Bacteroidales bacterium OttesenSCG-928-K22]|nr:TolC family protein [Bacteroidales bacterium OttesenSCG-928-K22]